MNSSPSEIQLSSKQLRQMQLIQLEILIEFDRVCRKYDIKYSLDGGTLLGAVRHKGFIPWDDDIDVVILRSEYERLYKNCKNEIDRNRFFFQEYRTDPYYRLGYSRMIRKGTVYNRAGHEHMKYKRGVFIDIFVLDNVPDNRMLRKTNQFMCYVFRKILWSESAKVTHSNFLLRKWYKLLSLIPRDLVFQYLKGFGEYNNNKSTQLVRHMTYPYPNNCKYGIQSFYFKELTEIDFEGYNFLASKYYKNYLTDLYGDFMKIPSKEHQRPRLHITNFGPVIPKLENEKLLHRYFINF